MLKYQCIIDDQPTFTKGKIYQGTWSQFCNRNFLNKDFLCVVNNFGYYIYALPENFAPPAKKFRRRKGQ